MPPTRRAAVRLPGRRILGVLAVLALGLVPAAVAWACNPQATLTLDKPTYSAGEQMQVHGAFFPRSTQLTLSFEPGSTIGTVTTSASGSFETTITAPAAPGGYVLSVRRQEPTSGLPKMASFQVQPADRDCSDFRNQAAAQDYFISRGGPSSDPDRLDGDNDGIACDSLPCPCATGVPGPAPAPLAPPLSPVPLPQPPRPNFVARVTRVLDGDTIKVRSRRGRRFTVRLLGIDTPEVFGGRECGGPQASARIKRLAPRRRKVRVTGDYTQPTRDRYGRLLAYVKTSSTQLNLAQLRAGWAKVFVVGRRFLRYESFVGAESRARAARRGVWGRCGGDFDRRL